MEEVNNNLKQPHRVALQDFFLGGRRATRFLEGSRPEGLLGGGVGAITFFSFVAGGEGIGTTLFGARGG